MKISFEKMNPNQNMEGSGKILHSTPSETGKVYNRMGYKIDISGTVMDNNAYGGHGKTAEDVRKDASLKDVQTERNYMAVMSNSMSKEDFAKLQEEGYRVGHTDIDTVVSIVDKIKATMAQSGQIVVGYTDDLSTEELTQITGDISLALSIADSFKDHNIPATEENVKGAVDAFTKAMQAPAISDGAMKYMVTNGQELTIENVYLAGYKSVANDKTQATGYFADDLAGYYGRKADDVDPEKLASQMERIVDEAGLPVNDATLGEAKWLVENGIALTTDSLALLHDVRQLTYPMEPDRVIDSIAIAISEGKKPQDAGLAKETDLYHQAAKLERDTAGITDYAIRMSIKKGEKLSLGNLIQNQRNASQGSDSAPLTGDSEKRFVKAKLQLEEVRLRMSLETNVRLLKRGFSIDTAPIQEVVERLREADETQAKVLFDTDSAQIAQLRKQLFDETLQKTDEIRQMPVDTVGRYAFLQRKVTLQDVHERGQNLRQEYMQAGRAYETMMTAPRSDLGDSIGKAFRNVDFLVEEMGLEVCEANSRAVRILAYNQIPVNRDSVAIVKNADLSLQRVVEKLTPANALYMVRDGVNPLDMSLDDLYEYLNQIPQTKEDEIEKLGKFIYKLDRKKGITQDEKEACIGVFRLIRQVEKGDFKALGAVVGADQSLSLMNLLKAVRTRNAGHMDHIVDDEFGGMQGAGEEANLITRQISSYYEKRIDQIYDHLEPEKLLSLHLGDETTVEQLAEAMEQQEMDQELEDDYQRENLHTIRQVAKVSDEAIGAVLEGKASMNADHLLAADYLRNYRGVTMRRVRSMAKAVDEATSRIATDEPPFDEQFGDAVTKLHQNLEGRPEAQESYQSFLEVSQNLLTEASMLVKQDKMDMQSVVMYMKQMQFLSDMSREENYEIPLSVGGEFTSLNLKIVHNKDEAGQVGISLQTLELSNVYARFRIDKGVVSGVVTSTGRDGLEQLRSRQIVLEDSIRESVGLDVSIQYVYTNKRDPKLEVMRRDTDESANTSDLYKIAKSFIKALTD